MRAWVVACVLLAGCGRLHFTHHDSGDGGDDTLPGDGPPLGFTLLTAYANQTCAVYKSLAYCWGQNTYGQIGDSTTKDASVPTAVGLPAGHVDSITQGENDACAIVDGRTYCFGQITAGLPMYLTLPTFASVVAGGRDFMCVLADQVYCFGQNGAGQLGFGDTNPHPSPVPLAYSGPTLVGLDAGDDHACACDTNHVGYCWGHNDNSTLGDNAIGLDHSPTPLVITNASELPLIAGWHACSLDAGTVDCWGEGDHGELGIGGSTDSPTAQPVLSLPNVTALATGGGPTDHDATCAITGGAVKCWGNGQHGRLGQGLAADSNVPVAVVGLPAAAVEVALGYDHSCARLVDGDIWCWGNGTNGQLGNGVKASSLMPVKVTVP